MRKPDSPGAPRLPASRKVPQNASTRTQRAGQPWVKPPAPLLHPRPRRRLLLLLFRPGDHHPSVANNFSRTVMAARITRTAATLAAASRTRWRVVRRGTAPFRVFRSVSTKTRRVCQQQQRNLPRSAVANISLGAQGARGFRTAATPARATSTAPQAARKCCAT